MGNRLIEKFLLLTLAVLIGMFFMVFDFKLLKLAANEVRFSFMSKEISWHLEQKRLKIATLAGCQAKTMMETYSDERFSKEWAKSVDSYGITARDIDGWMMMRCPPVTDREVEKSINNYFDKVGYLEDMDVEKEKLSRIEKSKKMVSYQRKFLNRDFSILKDVPKSSESELIFNESPRKWIGYVLYKIFYFWN